MKRLATLEKSPEDSHIKYAGNRLQLASYKFHCLRSSVAIETIFRSCLVNLKDILLLYGYIKFELHIFCSLGKIRKNSNSPRISDQQLRHFWHYWGVRKVGKRHFPTVLRIRLFVFKPS